MLETLLCTLFRLLLQTLLSARLIDWSQSDTRSCERVTLSKHKLSHSTLDSNMHTVLKSWDLNNILMI